MSENYMDRVHYYEELVHCAYDVPFWEYSGNLELETPVTRENELLTYFFRFGDASRRIEDYMKTGNPLPVFVSNSVSLMWVAAFLYEQKGKTQYAGNAPGSSITAGAAAKHKVHSCRKVIVMGPLYINESSPKKIREMIAGSDQPLDIRRRVTETLNRIPILPAYDLFQYTLMLHYALTGERISVSDIQHEERRSPSGGVLGAVQKIRDVLPDQDSPEAVQDATHQGVLSIDQRLLEIVQTGNVHYEDIFSKAALVSKGVRTHRADAIRGYKNSIIQFIALCSRAAIRGGLPAPLSYTLSDTYTDLVEGCSSITELMQLNHTMFGDYVRRVHLYQSADAGLSRPVRTACDYIRLHPDGDLSLEHLAELTGYTAYYLSRKFRRETGRTPADFMNEVKIERARLMLDTSNASIQEISDELRFRSRSYFTTVFRKYAGCSPTEYRERRQPGG